MEKPKRSRVDEIYKYCSENELPMLSDYDADFWEVYVNNFEYFDKLFMKTYRKFLVFGSESYEDDPVEENSEDFIFDVKSWLLANDKRYSELWRMQAISDTDYSVLDPYNVTETHVTESDTSMTDNMGARTDTKQGQTIYGARSISDSNSYSHGAKTETDTETLDYGADVTTTDSILNTGEQNNTIENSVSADNVSLYSPKDYQDNHLGTRHDTTESTETRQSRQDEKSASHSTSAYVDNESRTHTENTKSDSATDTNTYGAHTNTHLGEDRTEKTISKRGNMGIYSGSKLLSEHNELWTAFNFYKLIFDEIAEQFLRIVYF